MSGITGLGGVPKLEAPKIEMSVEQRNFLRGDLSLKQAAQNGDKNVFDINSLKEEDQKKLDEELKKLNESLASSGKMLKFKYNEEAKTTYVEVIDAESQKVVASMPPEFLIDLSIKMKELIGMFIDKKL
ncbi:flagellar protein FlaG [Cohnella hongkongensis]|uniref:Flagellar protein FlaG n=1 Tax=Cohnella hongkongensis TaxID=178337 RepID=A0ABV9FF54_9BACL